MKKIIIFFLVILPFVMNSCASHYVKGPETNSELTEETLKRLGIQPEKMVGLYVSFSQPSTFYKDSRVSREQEVQGGVLYVENLITGASIYKPKRVPVRYYDGPKKGKVVTRENGEIVTDEFLAEVIFAERGTGDVYLETLGVRLESDTLSDTFRFVRTPVFQTGQRNQRGSQNTGFTPFKREKIQNPKIPGAKTPLDHRYLIELLAYQEDMELGAQFKIEKETNLVYFHENGTRYYVSEGATGNFWFIDENSKYLYLEGFYRKESTDDQKIRVEAVTKKVGQ